MRLSVHLRMFIRNLFFVILVLSSFPVFCLARHLRIASLGSQSNNLSFLPKKDFVGRNWNDSYASLRRSERSFTHAVVAMLEVVSQVAVFCSKIKIVGCKKKGHVQKFRNHRNEGFRVLP